MDYVERYEYVILETNEGKTTVGLNLVPESNLVDIQRHAADGIYGSLKTQLEKGQIKYNAPGIFNMVFASGDEIRLDETQSINARFTNGGKLAATFVANTKADRQTLEKKLQQAGFHKLTPKEFEEKYN